MQFEFVSVEVVSVEYSESGEDFQCFVERFVEGGAGAFLP